MRLVTWNVNGLRAVVRKYGTLQRLLDELQADILCVQETKLTRKELTRDLCIATGWDSFFAFSDVKGGYSGVATFCRCSVTTPVAAEEGFTAVCSSSGDTGLDGSVEAGVQLHTQFGQERLAELDGEGRCVITDHGAFVLFNVYVPALSVEENVEARFQFKMDMLKALQMRMQALRARGRAVVLVGDLNVAPYLQDHCDPDPGGFALRPDRRWLRHLLAGGEQQPGFVDAFRHRHPHREGAYTCWNTASGARVNNYGTRIDHILLADALAPAPARSWAAALVDADILPQVQGSDHAPVYAQLDAAELQAMRGGRQQPQRRTALPLSTRVMFPGLQQTIVEFARTAQKRTAGESGLEGSRTGPSGRSGERPRKVPRKAGSRQAGILGFVQRMAQSPASEPPPAARPTCASAGAAASGPGACEDGESAAQMVQGHSAMVASFWSSLQQRMKPPVCRGHREPCVLRQVKKNNSNKGRLFYVCARADGAPPHGRCEHFEWVTKRPIVPKRSEDAAPQPPQKH